jgi:peptidoglycan-associated lipoprotein
MELVGVTAARIETISLGKEKPKATGHDEAAWAENRRADLVYR